MILFREARKSISPARNHPCQTPIRNHNHKQHHHHAIRMPLTPPTDFDGYGADSENDLLDDEVDEDLFHNVQRVLNASSTGAALFLSDELDGLMDEAEVVRSHQHMSSKIHNSVLDEVVFDEDSDDWSGWSSDQFPSEDEDDWVAFGKSLREALGAGSRSKGSPALVGTPGRKRKHHHEGKRCILYHQMFAENC